MLLCLSGLWAALGVSGSCLYTAQAINSSSSLLWMAVLLVTFLEQRRR